MARSGQRNATIARRIAAQREREPVAADHHDEPEPKPAAKPVPVTEKPVKAPAGAPKLDVAKIRKTTETVLGPKESKRRAQEAEHAKAVREKADEMIAALPARLEEEAREGRFIDFTCGLYAHEAEAAELVADWCRANGLDAHVEATGYNNLKHDLCVRWDKPMPATAHDFDPARLRQLVAEKEAADLAEYERGVKRMKREARQSAKQVIEDKIIPAIETAAAKGEQTITHVSWWRRRSLGRYDYFSDRPYWEMQAIASWATEQGMAASINPASPDDHSSTVSVEISW